jgi:hypothetical protein
MMGILSKCEASLSTGCCDSCRVEADQNPMPTMMTALVREVMAFFTVFELSIRVLALTSAK